MFNDVHFSSIGEEAVSIRTMVNVFLPSQSPTLQIPAILLGKKAFILSETYTSRDNAAIFIIAANRHMWLGQNNRQRVSLCSSKHKPNSQFKCLLSFASCFLKGLKVPRANLETLGRNSCP